LLDDDGNPQINEVRLIKEIRDYLSSNGGQATSQQLVQHFKPQLPPNSSTLFKKMLQEIANFKKKGRPMGNKNNFSLKNCMKT